MAGGAKETPRQRMVGMMYLVLTALLALQVSNSILDKFTFIDNALQHSIKVTDGTNNKIVDGIQQAVDKGGNRAKDVAVYKTAEEVKKKSSEVKGFILQMRNEIIKLAGGVDPETKKISKW